jgi:hypothetical protein
VPTGARYQLGATGTLDGEITTLIARLFPNGLETAAGTRWDGIRDKYAAGDIVGAKKRVAELSKWVKSKQSQMDTPPMNESRGTAASRLILYMSLYVFNGPNTAIPGEMGVGADAAAEIISPTAPALVQTEAKKASARFDAGTVADETIIVITQNTQFYGKKCSGPFNTKYCQYPLFYHYQSFPKQGFLKDVRTSICHVHRDPNDAYDASKYQPLPGVDHDKFVTLHDLPAEEKNYTPGGKPVPSDNVEVLPLNTTSIPSTPPTACSGTTYGQVALFEVPPAPSGVLGKAYAFAARTINGAAASVGRALTPENLYAVDNGEEHNTRFFSEFTNADTSGHPDLAVTASSASATSLVVGDPLTLSYSVANIGTAHSPVVNTVIRLTPVGETDEPSVTLTPASAISTAALYPEESRPGSAAVTIPADVAPGSYTLTALVSSANGLTEVALENNADPVAITVRPRAAAIAVSSTLGLVARAQANGLPVEKKDGMSQAGTINPLRAAVSALSESGGMSVLTEGSAIATWTDAAHGRVTFAHMGWTSANVTDGQNYATLNAGTDWVYTFTATASGQFALLYSLTVDGGTTNAFGLQGFQLTWNGDNGADEQQFLTLPGSGTVTKAVVAGVRYTVRLQNNANIYGPLGNLTAHMSGTFDWSVGTPPPPIP